MFLDHNQVGDKPDRHCRFCNRTFVTNRAALRHMCNVMATEVQNEQHAQTYTLLNRRSELYSQLKKMSAYEQFKIISEQQLACPEIGPPVFIPLKWRNRSDQFRRVANVGGRKWLRKVLVEKYILERENGVELPANIIVKTANGEATIINLSHSVLVPTSGLFKITDIGQGLFRVELGTVPVLNNAELEEQPLDNNDDLTVSSLGKICLCSVVISF